MPPAAPHDEKTERPCPASDVPIGRLSRCCDKVERRLPTPCAAMGRGRVFPAPPAPINTVRVQEKKGREKKKGKRQREKRERQQKGRETERERNRPRERERGTTETEKPKNRGYRQGNREIQSGRRKKKDKKEKPAGKETPTGVSAQWRRSAAAVTGSHRHRHRSAPENSHRHRQLNRPRSPPQVIFFSPLATGPNSSSCMKNVHSARSACKKKIISRLLCMRTVTGYMGFFPSPVFCCFFPLFTPFFFIFL